MAAVITPSPLGQADELLSADDDMIEDGNAKGRRPRAVRREPRQTIEMSRCAAAPLACSDS
jgi:hypothetical protein